MRRRVLSAVPLAAAVALVLTACGGGSGSNVAETAPVTAGDTLSNPQDSTDSTAALVKAVADYLDAQSAKRGADGAPSDKTAKALAEAIQNAKETEAKTTPDDAHAPVQTKEQLDELRASAQ